MHTTSMLARHRVLDLIGASWRIFVWSRPVCHTTVPAHDSVSMSTDTMFRQSPVILREDSSLFLDPAQWRD